MITLLENLRTARPSLSLMERMAEAGLGLALVLLVTGFTRALYSKVV